MAEPIAADSRGESVLFVLHNDSPTRMHANIHTYVLIWIAKSTWKQIDRTAIAGDGEIKVKAAIYTYAYTYIQVYIYM